MRVALHVGQLRQPVPGGIGRYVEGLVRHLPGGGVDLVPFGAGRWRYEMWHRLRRPSLRVRGGHDLVHAPSLAVPPTGPRPLVVTVHDLAFLTHPECFTARGRAFHRRGLALARGEAAAVIVPSRFTAGQLAAEGFAAERVHVVPHGVDAPVTAVAPTVTVDGPYLLAVGTIEPRKGLDVLLAAFSRLDGCSLVIAGPRGWGDVPDLGRPGVVAPGRVDEATLDSLYRGAAALVVPSRTEGFGLPALEAMARGCPVVASDAGALPEVVGDAGVLVPPGDADALAGALEALLADRDRRAALSTAGVRRAARYTWEACVAGHVAAYEAARSPSA